MAQQTPEVQQDDDSDQNDDARQQISDAQQLRLARSVAKELSATGAGTIVTACPLCKKAIARGADGREVLDLAEVVAAALVSKTVAAVPDKGV